MKRVSRKNESTKIFKENAKRKQNKPKTYSCNDKQGITLDEARRIWEERRKYQEKNARLDINVPKEVIDILKKLERNCDHNDLAVENHNKCLYNFYTCLTHQYPFISLYYDQIKYKVFDPIVYLLLTHYIKDGRLILLENEMLDFTSCMFGYIEDLSTCSHSVLTLDEESIIKSFFNKEIRKMHN